MGVSEKLQNFHFGVEYPFKGIVNLIKIMSPFKHSHVDPNM